MKQIKLSNGTTVKINENVVNDMELVDLLSEAQEDGTKYSAVVEKIFGKEKKKLYNAIRKDGIVPIASTKEGEYSIADAISEVMEQLGTAGKN